MADTNRTRWSNLPLEQAIRDGIRLDDLNDEQRMNIQALLRTVLSDQGYLKALSIMQYDQDTHDKLTSMNSPIAPIWPGKILDLDFWQSLSTRKMGF